MKAFTDCEVSRDQLLASLQAHAEADRIIKGSYWEDGKGCAVGCAIHDFRPGQEGEHALFPELFGVSRRFAHLIDGMFESLPNGRAQEWPGQVMSSVKQGTDTDRAVDEWLFWLLSDETSPIAQWREESHIAGVAALYKRQLDGDGPTNDEWTAAGAAGAAAWAAGDAAWAAGDAARDAGDAAGDAARDAAWAAGDAAWAAGDAAWAAARDAAHITMADALIAILDAQKSTV